MSVYNDLLYQVFSLAGGGALRWPVPRSEVPFLLGAWGPRVIRACAPHVDEVKVGGTARPSVVRTVLGEVREAAVAAGRPPDAVGLAVGAVCVVDRDSGAARALARQKVSLSCGPMRFTLHRREAERALHRERAHDPYPGTGGVGRRARSPAWVDGMVAAADSACRARVQAT